MIDELQKLLEVHSHLRDFPNQYKNLRAHIEARIQKLDDGVNQKEPAPRRSLGGANANA